MYTTGVVEEATLNGATTLLNDTPSEVFKFAPVKVNSV